MSQTQTVIDLILADRKPVDRYTDASGDLMFVFIVSGRALVIPAARFRRIRAALGC